MGSYLDMGYSRVGNHYRQAGRGLISLQTAPNAHRQTAVLLAVPVRPAPQICLCGPAGSRGSRAGPRVWSERSFNRPRSMSHTRSATTNAASASDALNNPHAHLGHQQAQQITSSGTPPKMGS
jgi:hypothetical protein